MSNANDTTGSVVRKAIEDAALDVQDAVRIVGAKVATRQGWANARIPASVEPRDAELYRQTYRAAAENMTGLVASLLPPA